jgi:transmembrane sensor
MQYFDSEENEEQLRTLIRAELEFEYHGNIVDSAEGAILSQVKSNLIAEIEQERLERSALIAYWIKMAAFWLLVIGVSVGLLFTRFWKQRNQVIFTTVKTLPGERKKIALSDGTKIWLSPSSKLEYPDQLIGNSREVKLEGEAFFNVAKDKTHPFIIHSDHMDTRVVGTSFNVQSFRGQAEYKVTVVTGIVRVSGFDSSNKNEKTVVLQPDQQSRFNTQSGSIVSVPYPDAKQMLKLKDGILNYNSASVQEIVADLSRYYGKGITIESHSKSCLFSGEFNCTRPIDIVLEQLATGINAKVIIQKDKYILKGGCEE